MTVTRRRMLLDCDPGHDDAIAMLLALARPEWEVLGLSIVAGNTTLDNAVRAARQVLTVAERTDVAVHAGMPQPMVRPLVTAAHVHGESGLEGPVLPEPTFDPRDIHAIDWLTSVLSDARDRDDPIEVAATGPLTNLGTVLRRDPTLARGISRLVFMGGAITEGNITPAAEFNIFVDPEAAAIVVDADTDVTMVGLDVTHRTILPASRFGELRALGTPVGALAADLMDFFWRFHRNLYAFDGVPIHDACAVAALLRPDLLETRRLRVDVETSSRHCDGRTVVDLWGVSGREPNVHVGTDMDTEGFLDLLFSSLATY
ncbi:MAG: inosine-uridine preferring nucleoside hydrolase [Actinomycetota bacterium]